MTISMKEKMKEIKRNLIVEEAEKLFFEKGYDQTSADDISKEAGISKSTLYTYFNSKEEILVRVFLRAAVESQESYESAIVDKDTGFDQMKAYSLASYNCYLKQPKYLYLFDLTVSSLQKGIALMKETRELLSAYSVRNSKMIIGILEKGLEDGSVRSDLDVELTRSYLVNTIQHIVKLIILSPNFEDKDYKTALEYFLEGFKSK